MYAVTLWVRIWLTFSSLLKFPIAFFKVLFHLFRAMLDSALLILTLFEFSASRCPSIASIVVYFSEYIHINGRIILKRIFTEWDVGMDWINLAENKDRWRTVMNAVMNLRVP